MAFQVPTTEPDEIIAGDLATWTRSFSDFAPGTWALSYALVKLGDTNTPITFTASTSAGQFLVSVPAATTALWSTGLYTGQAYVTSGTERHLVWEGKITITANFAASQVPDQRSTARRMLDTINATLETLYAKTISISTVEGVELQTQQIDKLLEAKKYWAAQVAKEENRAMRPIFAAFTKPTW